jgi:drug/metabolite transporter (DMT)-like permease
MTPAGQRLEPLVLLVCVGFLQAVNVNLAKAGQIAGVGPVTLAFWMNAGAGLILLAVAVAARQPPSLATPYLASYLVTGAVSFAFPTALNFAVAGRVGPAYGSIVFALSPLITYLLALTVRLERLSGPRAVGLAVGLAGSAVVVVARLDFSTPGERLWILLAMAIPASVALGNILRTLLWPKGASALALAPGTLLTSALLLLPLTLSQNGLPVPVPGLATAAGLVLSSLIAASALFYGLYFRLQKAAGPVYLSQIGYVGTGFGVAIAVAVFADPVSAGMLLGIALIVAGILLVNSATNAGA